MVCQLRRYTGLGAFQCLVTILRQKGFQTHGFLPLLPELGVYESATMLLALPQPASQLKTSVWAGVKRGASKTSFSFDIADSSDFASCGVPGAASQSATYLASRSTRSLGKTTIVT